MKGKYLNKKILEDLQNIVEYGKDTLKNDSVMLSALAEERDTTQIKKGNPEEMDKLYESIIDQLAHVGIYIGCMLEKLRVLIRLFDDCQKGDGNFTSIFEVAEGEDKALEKRYFNNITLSKIELQTLKDALSGLRQFLATESPLKTMKNAFYFTSKALFVLKIFKFLS